MKTLLLTTFLITISQKIVNTRIYFSDDEDIYIILSEGYMDMVSNPYHKTQSKISFEIVNDTLFFGNNESAIISEDKIVLDGKFQFKLLSDQKSNEFKEHMKLSSSIRIKIAELLEETYSEYPDFRVGNINISLKETEMFNNLIIKVVCRYRDTTGINRGFESNISGTIEGDNIELMLQD